MPHKCNELFSLSEGTICGHGHFADNSVQRKLIYVILDEGLNPKHF